MKSFTIEEIRQAIDAEPEYPGEMPSQMQRTIEVAMTNGEMEVIVELMRISVRQTKEGIKERLGLAKEETKAEHHEKTKERVLASKDFRLYNRKGEVVTTDPKIRCVCGHPSGMHCHAGCIDNLPSGKNCGCPEFKRESI